MDTKQINKEYARLAALFTNVDKTKLELVDELLKKANELATKVYEEAAKNNQKNEETTDSEKEEKDDDKKDDVVDAEYEEK